VRRRALYRKLKCAPHALGITEAAFLGDGLDRNDGLFEFAAGKRKSAKFGAFMGSTRRPPPSLLFWR